MEFCLSNNGTETFENSLTLIVIFVNINIQMLHYEKYVFGGTISLDMGQIVGLHCMRKSFRVLWRIYVFDDVALVVSIKVGVYAFCCGFIE